MDTKNFPSMDALEDRTLYSVTIAQSHVATKHLSATPRNAPVSAKKTSSTQKTKTRAISQSAQATRSDAVQKSFVISFLGLGGIGWSNNVIATITADDAARTDSVGRTYLESQGDAALEDFFQSIDANGDHIITAAEISGVNVRVLGYSFGGIQAANFSESLDDAGETVVGYKLRSAVPVHSLVTIDPVNSTPVKHTDGVRDNVRSFTNFYQRNSGPSDLALTSSITGAAAGDVVFSGDDNPIGDSLKSGASQTRQVRTDLGSFAQRTTTRAYDATHNATIEGSGLDHATMPWFLYDDIVTALK